jgi:hypothetical protein
MPEDAERLAQVAKLAGLAKARDYLDDVMRACPGRLAAELARVVQGEAEPSAKLILAARVFGKLGALLDALGVMPAEKPKQKLLGLPPDPTD